MKKILLCLTAVVLALSCNKNDDGQTDLDGECQGVIDTAPPGVFYIKLVDSVGNNLIENGFYDRDKISSKLNDEDFDFQTLRFDGNPDLENLLVVSPIGYEGDNRWLLTLSETDVDTLNFSMSSEEIRYISDGSLFCGSRFILNSANYNGNTIEWEEESTIESFLKIPVTVIKATD